MKLKLALVGIAHFLTQGLQTQQAVEAKAPASENTQAEVVQKNKNTLPEIFEQKLLDSKGGTIIASPSHETSSGTNCHGKS